MKRTTSSYSRYIRTSWRLSASATLPVPELNARIRFFSAEEARVLNESAQRNNPFIRRPYGNPFYPRRIESLSDRTVIEIYSGGSPSEVWQQLNHLARLIENVAILSSSLSLSRSQLHKCLSIAQDRGDDFDIVIGPRFKSFRSKSPRTKVPKGILVDSRFVKRFQANGFIELTRFCSSNVELSAKVSNALSWLVDSRQEPRLSAAIVKSSIALESLLIFNDSEPLSRSLSERCAYLLTPKPETRARISRAVKDFYEARSGVVHGGRRKTELISPTMIEGVDRLILLACIVLAGNRTKWASKDALQSWCESQKWDAPDLSVAFPFSLRYLQAAIEMMAPK